MTNEAIPNLTAFDEAALDQAFAALERQAREAAAALDGEAAVEAFRLEWLGRKQGRLNEVSGRWLKAAPPEAKKALGLRFNALKAVVEGLLDAAVGGGPSDAALKAEAIDITLPGTRRLTGRRAPDYAHDERDCCGLCGAGLFGGRGAGGRDRLLQLREHELSARAIRRATRRTRWWLRVRSASRCATGCCCARTLRRCRCGPWSMQPPPVRIVIPGKVHRNDAADATHSPIFHQVEGLCVDTNITFSDLKGTLDHAMKALFGSAVKTRFFPSFFPFTEPSADVQISCIFCGGKGCRKCKQSGWIELLGCGMVDPAVFAFAAEKQPAYDPKKISGFAFGMGVERIAMMKYGISEIGQFFAGDMRFLGQFA